MLSFNCSDYKKKNRVPAEARAYFKQKLPTFYIFRANFIIGTPSALSDTHVAERVNGN